MKQIFEFYQILKAVNKTNISIPQFLILDFVVSNINATSSKLAKLLKVTAAAITPHVDSLIDNGLIERVHSQYDRRLIILNATSKGSQTIKDWKKDLLSAFNA